MKLRIISITLILTLVISCNRQERLNENEVKKVLSVFLNQTISGFLPHSICCQFQSELSDSSFKKHVLNLMKLRGQFDSTNHSKNLLSIYTRHKGNNILPYIDYSKYKYFEYLDYHSKDTITNMHFVITYPILYNNNKNCFIYTITLYPKQRACTQRIYIFTKKEGKWLGNFYADLINYDLPPFVHHDKGLIVQRKWLKK